MELTVVEGHNNKKFIKISDLKTSDKEALKILESVVTRTEYKPFSKGFDKNVTDSYLIQGTYIPGTFIQDISKKFLTVYPQYKIKNQELLFNNTITRADYNHWLESLELPEKYNLFDDKYMYQPESVYRAALFMTSRIEIGTGGGKTLITFLYCKFLLEFILKNNKKILIIVPRKTLAKQTKDEFDFCDTHHHNKLVVETIYSGSKRIENANVVIGTYQSLCEYDEEYFEDFGAIICDEAHGSKTYSIKTEIFNKIKNATYFFGMTGTWPKEKTLDYIHVVAMWGPLVYVKKTWELIEDGNVVPVEINAIQVHYPEHCKDFIKGLKQQDYTGTERYRIEKAWFQNCWERTELIIKLVNNFDGNHLILVDTVEYCNYLKDILNEFCSQDTNEVIYGDISEKERDRIIKTMKENDNFNLIATYETMSTGVSIPNIMYVHFPDGGKSEIRIKQSYGRGLRLHPKKDKLYVFDYQDDIPLSSFKSHAKIRNGIYTEEKIPIKFSNVTLNVKPF